MISFLNQKYQLLRENITFRKLNMLIDSSTNNSGSGVVNIYRLNTLNIGDRVCAPHLYFEELGKKKIDIWGYKGSFAKTKSWHSAIMKASGLVIGGGGLLNRNTFNNSIDLIKRYAQKGKKTVLWGVGHNSPIISTWGNIYNYSNIIDDFGIIGVRDYNMRQQWVPCVSCMASELDNEYRITNEISVLIHEKDKNNKQIIDLFQDIPIMYNDEPSFEKVIKFIGSTETLVTNSYHAMYWGMLLKKKVIVIPNSSKMFSFKYQPALCFNIYDYKAFLKKANIYDGLLEECRYENIKFSEKVFNYLNL